MSIEDAREFLGKLRSDGDFRDYITDVIRKEGFLCSIEEVRKAEWEYLMQAYKGGCGPYSSDPQGYENWCG
jgi:hypothetical protein